MEQVVSESSPSPEKPQPLFLLRWMLRALFWFIALLTSFLLLLIYYPPAIALEGLEFLIEKIVFEQTGLPIDIGTIKTLKLRPQNQLIEIDDFHLYGYEGATIPFAVLPTVRWESDLLSFLRGQNQVAILSADHIMVHVIQDAQGKINLRPQIKASEKEKDPNQPAAQLPRIKIAIDNMLVMYRDLRDRYDLDERAVVPMVRGDLYDSKHISANAKVRNPLASFWGYGQMNIFDGKGWAQADINAPDLAGVNRYVDSFAKSINVLDDLKFMGGDIDGDLTANWQSYKMDELHYNLSLLFNDVQAFVPFYKDLVVLNGKAVLDENRTQVPGLTIETEGSVLKVQGWVDEYLSQPVLDLKLVSPGLNVGRVLGAIEHPVVKPIIRDYRPRGSLLTNLRVTGTPDKIAAAGQLFVPTLNVKQGYLRQTGFDFAYQPDYLVGDLKLGSAAFEGASLANGQAHLVYRPNLIQAQAFVAQAAYQDDARLRNAQIDFNYRNQFAQATVQIASAAYQKIDAYQINSLIEYRPERLDISYLRGQIFDGSVFSSASLQLRGAQRLQASLKGYGLSLTDLQQDLGLNLPKDYRATGLMNLDVQAGGTLSNPVATGTLVSDYIGFPQSDTLTGFDSLLAKFSYSKPLSQLAIQTQSQDLGTIKAAATLRNMDRLAAKVEAHTLPLQSVNRFTKDKFIEAGTASLVANMAGSLQNMQRNWMAFTGNLDLNARQLDLNVPLKDRLYDQHIDQADLKLGWQNGLATINQLLVRNQDSKVTADGRVSVPLLLAKTNLEDAFRGKVDGQVDFEDFPVLEAFDIQSGQVKLALEARGGSGKRLNAKLLSSGENIQVQGTKIGNFELDADLDNQLITIHQAQVSEQENQLFAKGTIDLATVSPTLNLDVQGDDFDLQSLLAFVPSSVKDKLDPPEDVTSLPPADNLPKKYTLPEIKQRSLFQYEGDLEPDGQVPDNKLSIRWKEVYDHWDQWKLQPNTVVAAPLPEKKALLDTIKGKLSVNAHIAGTVADPDLAMKGLLQAFEIKDVQLSEAFVDATFKDKLLNLEQLYMLEKNGGLLEARGQIDLEKEIAVEVQGKGLRLQAASPFLEGKDMRLNGSLDLIAYAEGSIQDPKVTADLQLDRFLFNRIFLDHVQAQTDYQQGYIRDTRLEVNYADQQVIANGDVPVLDLKQPMDVSLQLQDDSFGLINLFTNAIDWRKGSGSVLVRVLGSPLDPQLEGSVSLKDTEIYLTSLKESVTDLKVRGELRRLQGKYGITPQLQLLDVTGKYGGGDVSANGTIDLVNLKPEYIKLNTQIDNVKFQFTRPGLFETTTPIKSATIRIGGLLTDMKINGKIFISEGGEIYFPFLKDRQDLPTSSDFADAEAAASAQPGFRLEFDKLTAYLPADYQVKSPIFDIPIRSAGGIRLNHSGKGGERSLRMSGEIDADSGTLYLLNNVLNLDLLKVKFNPDDIELNPRFEIKTSFNVQGADQPVVAGISGSLEDVKENRLKFDFSNTQGLSNTDILGQLSGFSAVEGLSQGDVAGVAAQFSDSVLRGLFDPLTSRIAQILGLKDLSLGLAGQSINGPIFKFTIRSSPFFFIDEFVEQNLQQLEFLNRINVVGTGLLSDNPSYEVGANYNINQYWSLDYKYEQVGAVQNVRVNGNFLLDYVLRSLNDLRVNYFGWQDPGSSTQSPQANPQSTASPAPTPKPAPELKTDVSSSTSNGSATQATPDASTTQLQNLKTDWSPALW